MAQFLCCIPLATVEAVLAWLKPQVPEGEQQELLAQVGCPGPHATRSMAPQAHADHADGCVLRDLGPAALLLGSVERAIAARSSCCVFALLASPASTLPCAQGFGPADVPLAQA